MNLKLARNIRLGVKNLLLHKLRSMLTMLGVVFGVGSVVAMLSVGEGASKEAVAQIRKLGSNNILVEAQEPVEVAGNSGGQQRRLSMYGIQYDDVTRAQETIPGVERVVPAKTVRKQGRLGDRVEELRLVGTTPAWFDLVPRETLAGRTLGAQDMSGFNDVVVLTESGARKLLATRATVGSRVRIGGASFQVIGISQSEGGTVGRTGGGGGGGSGGRGGLATPDQDVDAYVPLPVMRERFGDVFVEISSGGMTREQVQLHQMIVEVADLNDVPEVAGALERMFQTYHTSVDYKMTVPLSLLEEAEATKRRMNVVLGSIAGISLLVGGIGIMNIMLASVTERTREIGIRRAIGARRKQIIGQFLIETLVLSTAGGLIGMGLGALIPQIIEWRAGMPVSTEPWMLGLSVGISMFVGIVFGLYPAVRAANLDPIQALRHE
jgi:putative ABC transport system permease protein